MNPRRPGMLARVMPLVAGVSAGTPCPDPLTDQTIDGRCIPNPKGDLIGQPSAKSMGCIRPGNSAYSCVENWIMLGLVRKKGEVALRQLYGATVFARCVDDGMIGASVKYGETNFQSPCDDCTGNRRQLRLY